MPASKSSPLLGSQTADHALALHTPFGSFWELICTFTLVHPCESMAILMIYKLSTLFFFKTPLDFFFGLSLSLILCCSLFWAALCFPSEPVLKTY